MNERREDIRDQPKRKCNQQMIGSILLNRVTRTDMDRRIEACRPASPESLSVPSYVRLLGSFSRRKPELRCIANGSLRCADDVPGLWRLDVREQYRPAITHQHENERSCATYVLH